MSTTYTDKFFALLEDHRPLNGVERIVAGVLASAILAGVYGAIALAMVDRLPTMRYLPTFVDTVVPFTPFAVLPYAWIFPQAIAPLAFIRDRRVLARTALAYVSMIVVGIPFWVLLAVTVPRTPLVGDDLWTWGIGVVRWVDPPTNCFPSMHVAESFLSALLVRRLDRPMGNLLFGLAVAVWWSTMAIHQHWFLDGVAGAFLAFAANHFAFAIRPLPDAVWASDGGRGRFAWIAAFFGAVVVLMAAVWASGRLPMSALEARW